MKTSILLFLCTAMSGAIAAPATTTPATTLPPPPTPYVIFDEELDPYIPEGYDMGIFLKNGAKNGTEIMIRTKVNIGFTDDDKKLVEERLKEKLDVDAIAKAYTTEVDRRKFEKTSRLLAFQVLTVFRKLGLLKEKSYQEHLKRNLYAFFGMRNETAAAETK